MSRVNEWVEPLRIITTKRINWYHFVHSYCSFMCKNPSVSSDNIKRSKHPLSLDTVKTQSRLVKEKRDWFGSFVSPPYNPDSITASAQRRHSSANGRYVEVGSASSGRRWSVAASRWFICNYSDVRPTLVRLSSTASEQRRHSSANGRYIAVGSACRRLHHLLSCDTEDT